MFAKTKKYLFKNLITKKDLKNILLQNIKIHCIKTKIAVNNFARKQGVKNEKILYVERRRSKMPF